MTVNTTRYYLVKSNETGDIFYSTTDQHDACDVALTHDDLIVECKDFQQIGNNPFMWEEVTNEQ